MNILITGASSGIGAGICTHLQSLGHEVINVSRSGVSGTKNFNFDLGNIERLEDEFSEFLQGLESPIDAFVHSAGISYTASVKHFDLYKMQEVMNVNLYSAMIIIKILLRRFNKSALKNIVFISSVFSKVAGKSDPFYAASKGAIDSYMRSIAVQLAPKIRANSIVCSAIFDTKIGFFYDEKARAELLNSHPLGFGEVKDIANSVEFLLSDRSRWITGQQIVVDGGYTAI